MTAASFKHLYFDVYAWDAIPIGTDCYLMEDTYIEEYEKFWLDFFALRHERDPVGYVSQVSVRQIDVQSLELSLYITSTRFHELTIRLPRDRFIKCVGCHRYDDKPHIFVKAEWLFAIYERSYSAFALVDAIGVKEALRQNHLSRAQLIRLRDCVDEIAIRFNDVAFVSFADSLLLKSNWSLGHFRSPISYTFDPDVLLRVIKELRHIYADVLNLKIYAVLTQGSNEYDSDSLVHVSASGNHLCLNSLGVPFAELLAIDAAVAEAVKRGDLAPAELYIDEKYLHSLRFRFEFDRDVLPRCPYRARMMATDGTYYCAPVDLILQNIRAEDET